MVIELSEERIQELEKIFEKEINDYKNKTICKQKFIYLIKKCNIMEFCYLYQTYIGNIESVRRFPTIDLKEYDYFIETIDKSTASYNNDLRKNYPNRNIRKLVQIEKMAHKKTNYKQHK